MPQMRSRLRVERRSVHDLSDTQIETLIAFGHREAELVDQIEAAVRAGDRDLAWRLGQQLVEIQDQAAGEPKPAA